MKPVFTFIYLLFASYLFGQKVHVQATHVKINLEYLTFDFLELAGEPHTFHTLRISEKTQYSDSLIFEKAGGVITFDNMSKGDTVVSIEHLFMKKAEKNPFSRNIIYTEDKESYVTTSQDSWFVTCANPSTKQKAYAPFKSYKHGRAGQIPMILNNGTVCLMLVSLLNRKMLLANGYRITLRSVFSDLPKNHFEERFCLGKRDQEYVSITPDTLHLLFSRSADPIATLVYDKIFRADHFIIFQRNGSFFPFLYSKPQCDTLTPYRAFHLQSTESEYIQLLKGNKLIWLNSNGDVVKPMPDAPQSKGVFGHLFFKEPGQFIYQNPDDTYYMNKVIRVMKDEVTPDLDVKGFMNYHGAYPKLADHIPGLGFDQNGSVGVYLLIRKGEDYQLVRTDQFKYDLFPKVSAMNPHRFVENGLIGFFPGTSTGKYVSLDDFRGGFARYEKPDKSRGLVSLAGEEFPDLKN
jgi:hypothetical protein